jgi:hypothetical protein
MTDAALLVGRWMLISDEAGRTAEFTSGGELTYFIDIEGRELVMRLTYRVDGGEIVTTQPPEPEEIRAHFTFADADTLVLDYTGERFTFRRLLA